MKEPPSIPAWVEETDKILLMRMLDKDPQTRISAEGIEKLFNSPFLN